MLWNLLWNKKTKIERGAPVVAPMKAPPVKAEAPAERTPLPPVVPAPRVQRRTPEVEQVLTEAFNKTGAYVRVSIADDIGAWSPGWNTERMYKYIRKHYRIEVTRYNIDSFRADNYGTLYKWNSTKERLKQEQGNAEAGAEPEEPPEGQHDETSRSDLNDLTVKVHVLVQRLDSTIEHTIERLDKTIKAHNHEVKRVDSLTCSYDQLERLVNNVWSDALPDQDSKRDALAAMVNARLDSIEDYLRRAPSGPYTPESEVTAAIERLLTPPAK